MTNHLSIHPGLIALFGSGETALAGRGVHEYLFRRLRAPIRVAVLETPAGFQPNSAWGRAAWRSAFPPDGKPSGGNFMGPGSPTYAVRHLAGTRAWQRILARQGAL